MSWCHHPCRSSWCGKTHPLVCLSSHMCALRNSRAGPGAYWLEVALSDWPGEIHIIGDCLAPRTAEEAVLEGLRAGVAV